MQTALETKTLSDDEVLMLLERSAAAGEDIYDTAVNAGMNAAEKIETGKWQIGDLALLVGKKYGKDIISDFAVAINVEKGRVKEYRTVCGFWQKSARADILTTMPVITYTHMRDAMRLKSPAEAFTFLEQCADNAWTVEQARLELAKRLGKPDPALKLLDLTTLSYSVDTASRVISINLAPNYDLTDLKARRSTRVPIRFVLYEGK